MTSGHLVTLYDSGSGTWTKDPRTASVTVVLVGGGGNGGNGSPFVTWPTDAVAKGGGGGGGGSYFSITIPASALNATETYSVGGPSTESQFAGFFAYGGGQGETAIPYLTYQGEGGGGGGVSSNGGPGDTTGTYYNAGQPQGIQGDQQAVSGQGAYGTNSTGNPGLDGGNGEYGGGGGAGGYWTGPFIPGNGGSSLHGGAAGGGGGGCYEPQLGQIITVAGTSGGIGGTGLNDAGNGGAGGAGTYNVTGGTGEDGVWPGGGGGGGGGNGGTLGGQGVGGAGANGMVLIVEHFLDVIPPAPTGIYTNLWRVDEQELTSYSNTWSTPADQNPTEYSILSPPPLTVQLSPAPTADRPIDLLTVNTGDDFTPTTAATIAGVPDDMTWIVKWGAMADLLMKDGPAQDPERAAYCEQRYRHGVELARLAASITAARINTVPLLLCALAELDAFQIGWQSAANSTPDTMATAGLNYIALNPPPAAAIPITLDVIRNAKVPTSDTDLVQIGREMVTAILDYAEHLAMFKVGGAEWSATQQGFEVLMQMAGNFNNRMAAATKIWDDLHNVTNAEESTRLRIKGVRSKQDGS